MNCRRLVGIDLGIASAHTVRVLDGEGNTIAQRKAWPTTESLGEVETAALAGCPDGTRLEVVVEPTGPAWLPIAVFFTARGHVVHRSRRPRRTTCADSCPGTPRPTGSTPTPSPGCRCSTPQGCSRWCCPAPSGRRWTAGSGPPTDSPNRVRCTSAGSKDLARQLLPMTPLTGELGVADLAVLERYADPNALVKLGLKRLATMIEKTSKGHQGIDRARQWIGAAQASIELYAGHPAVAFVDLAAEIATEVRLLRAVQSELAKHAAERETAYRWVDPAGLARSLPGVADIGGPALVAAMGDPARFAKGKHFRSFSGLVPKASETGDSDRKGQAMSKAGSSLLRTTLVCAADNARKQDPQLARIYYVQMVERGKDHLGALCVVAANLAERFWAVMTRGMPYVICDTNGRPVEPDEAKAIIDEHWTMPTEVRARRRSKKVGKAPQKVLAGQPKPRARGAGTRGDLPQPASSTPRVRHVNRRSA